MVEPGAAKVIKGDCINPGGRGGKCGGANASALKYIQIHVVIANVGKDGNG